METVEAFCVTWQGHQMPAPAFYYFRHKEAAIEELKYFQARGYKCSMYPVVIPHNVAIIERRRLA